MAEIARKNLVALGTAAVLAIYAAGFDRTRAAAQRWADEDISRRPSPPSRPTGEIHVAPRVDSAPTVAKPAAPKAKKSDTVVSASSKANKAAKDSVVPVAAVPPTAVVDSSVKTDSATQTKSDRGPYKDGTYYGWGTSRHGDIQAGIEITNGRITAAWIEKCLTQYSCSWIGRLPDQVEKRQTADVDFVSGATQSTNAFYYGVVQALAQAK